MKPNTQYTKSGDINIAYQIFGSGPVDLIYIPGWVSNIDWMWSCPEFAHFLLELGKMARVILFDKRGTGLSDRVAEVSTLEQRMDDIRAVMDAAGCQKAVLFGHSEGGSASALFAATFPHRTISLITFGAYARRRYATYYPWGPTDQERQVMYDLVEKNWGESGEPYARLLAPSKANDSIFIDWLSNYIRSSATPEAALKLIKMNAAVDVTNILSSINVPTLIMQRNNDQNVNLAEGHFLADRIKGSKFVELEGSDNLFWVGNMDATLKEINSFISDLRPRDKDEKRLFTLMTARVISPKKSVGDDHWKSINETIETHQGQVIYRNGHNFLSNFKGPSKAAYCSLDLMKIAKENDIKLAIGIHIQECSLASSIEGETKLFVESILDPAEPNQIYVTQTVRYLLAGTRLYFEPYSRVNFETISGESLQLFTIVTNDLTEGIHSNGFPKKLIQNDSFVQQALKIINLNLNNQSFGVMMLGKEIGLSERQLQRKIKIIFNKAPGQLISQVRLLKAKELLQKDNNITEVAYQTGFTNPSYFSKLFKQAFGLSPSDYRNQLTE